MQTRSEIAVLSIVLGTRIEKQERSQNSRLPKHLLSTRTEPK
jgi:hypothetical protein